MAVLYPGTSVSGYNSNPPPDDGSTVSTNLITWAGIKSKIGDPLNTFDTSVDSNITSAFGKTLDGATVVSTGVNYAMTAADQGRLIKATASGINITTPDAGTVTAPFTFAVNNQSAGTINLNGNATNAQTVDGSTSQVLQPGSGCVVKTDGTNWFTYGLKPAQNTTTGSNYGFTDPVNLNLSCSVGSNILTVTVLTKAGNTPSAGDPVLIPFRDTTNANGDPVWVTVNSALTMTTNAVGATLGTQNSNIPFRFWIVAFNNAGTAVLALWHSGAGSSAVALNPWNEGVLQSTTGISAAATSAGVFYTPNGTSLSSKAFRTLGYLDYTSGLATAGTYASAPNIVQLFGPGIKKPGDLVQTVYALQTFAGTTTGASTAQTVTGTTASISPSAAANLVFVTALGTLSFTGSSGSRQVAQLSRGSGPTLIGNTAFYQGTTANQPVPTTVMALDAPGTTSSTTYSVYIKTDSSGQPTVWNAPENSVNGTTLIKLDELMA